MLGDGDTGWHVRIGEWILAHGQVPRQDMFSFTKPGQPFFAWEWLWDVGAAWLHQRWGLGGGGAGEPAGDCVYHRAALPPGLPALRESAGVHRCSPDSRQRPPRFTGWRGRTCITMLMMVVFLTILERVREGRTRLLWTLPVLMIPWANLHGGFLIGIVIVGAYAAGELLRAVVTRDQRRAPRQLAGGRPVSGRYSRVRCSQAL